MIIGITGTIGAGKGTVVEFLITKGFAHYSVRSFLIKELTKRGKEISRTNMYELANELRAISPGYIVEALLKEAHAQSGNSIVESVRSLGEVAALKSYPKTFLFAVDADPKVRYERVKERKSVTDNISFETFLKEEERESTSDNPNEGNLQKCIEKADFVFLNNDSKAELFNEIEKVLVTIS